MSLPKRRSIVRPRTARKRNICSNAAKSSADFCPNAKSRPSRSKFRSSESFAEFFKGSGRHGSFHDDGVCAAAEHACCATKRSANRSCPSFPMKRARSVWTRSSAKSAFIRPRASSTSRSISSRCFIITKPRTARFSKKELPKPVRCRRSSRRAPAYATHGKHMIPFYIYYSMFGFQRIGDLMWLAGDIKAKGFLLGATAGRTTLNGEGLQHRTATACCSRAPIPTLLTYDPAFAYEVAVIIADGMRRMYRRGRGRFLLPHALQRKLRDAARCRQASKKAF